MTDGVPARGYGSWAQYWRRFHAAPNTVIGLCCRDCAGSTSSGICVYGCCSHLPEWRERNGLLPGRLRPVLAEAGRILADQPADCREEELLAGG